MKYLKDAKLRIWSMKKMLVEPKTLCKDLQSKEGLLVGLHDSQRKFLGLGVLRTVNCEQRTLKVRASSMEKPAVVVFGKVRLDENLREISFV